MINCQIMKEPFNTQVLWPVRSTRPSSFTSIRTSPPRFEHCREEHQLYCCSTFHSLGRVFNNGNNPYHKVSMKRSLTCSWAVLLTSVDKRYIWVSLSFWCQLMHKIIVCLSVMFDSLYCSFTYLSFLTNI
jgi:hypothetical protein